jgi:VanZ family protein
VLPLRYPWLWLSIGLALVVCVVAASIFPNVRIVTLGLTWADKAAHAVSYGLLMIWFSGLYARRFHGIVAVTLLALGLALEMIQWTLPYRFFESADLLANAAGVLVGLGLSFWLFAGWCQRMESRLDRYVRS